MLTGRLIVRMKEGTIKVVSKVITELVIFAFQWRIECIWDSSQLRAIKVIDVHTNVCAHQLYFKQRLDPLISQFHTY